MRPQLAVGLAGELEYYPHPKEGPPTGDGTVTITTGGTTLLHADLAAATATLDAASQALTADVQGGYPVVEVADTSAFVRGRRYLYINHEGRIQPVLLDGKTDTQLRFDEPLRFGGDAATSTVKGYRLSVELTAEHTASKHRLVEALWSYSVVTGAKRKPLRFDIVDRPFVLEVDEERIEGFASMYGETVGARGLQHKGFEAAERAIWRYLSSLKVHPDLVYEREHLEDAAALYVLALGSSEREDFFMALHKDALKQFRDSKAWVDEDEDLEPGTGPEEDVNSLARILGLV